jgi:hypothetical protein
LKLKDKLKTKGAKISQTGRVRSELWYIVEGKIIIFGGEWGVMTILRYVDPCFEQYENLSVALRVTENLKQLLY